MHRPIVLAFAAFALAIPASGSAQTTTSERERERIERDREREQEARDRARERGEQKREREQEKLERIREREQERRERESAGSLDTTVAFDARGSVTVICPQGAVIVVGSDKNEIRVRARTENGAIRFMSSGSRATLEPASGRGCSDGRFEITVPTGAKVSARSWSGSVSVRGVHGDVDTQTQSADIEVRDVGRLDLETLSGDVTINGVKGDANINTVSGDVELTGLRGDLEAETVSGDLRLNDIVAKQVRTHTTSGDVDFAGPIADGGRYEFNTHSGEIGLELPRDVGAQLSVSTFNGEIDSEFPITLKSGTDHGIGSAQAKKLSFTLGQGNARIVAETFSGNITIRSTSRSR
jgi:DUF4097 and DUF4098 domain-containing protein YvlB